MSQITDDLSRGVALPAGGVRRIVSLSPAATENLYALGAGGLLVGGTTADDYPPPAARLPRVGDFYQPVVERIRALRPDLIVVETATARRADMDNLAARLKAPLYVCQSRRYDDVARQLTHLGQITGHTREARTLSQAMADRAAHVARHVAGKKPVRVFVQIDQSALYAAGPGSFMDDLIRRAGGVNIVPGTNPFPLVSREVVLAARPEVYIQTVGSPGPNGPPAPPGLDPAFARIPLRRYTIDANLVSRPTPRLADGLAALAALLHP